MSPDTLPTPDCGLALERIERALDADLTGDERRQLDSHLDACDFCADSARDAAAVHGLFRRTETLHCPDSVVDAVLAQVEAEAPRPVRRAGSPAPRRSLTGWMAAAVAVALVALALFPSRPDPTTPAPADEPTLAEVQAAAEEMRTAFALVSRSMARTTDILDEQLRGHVTTPVLDGLERGGIRPATPRTSANENEHSGLVSPPPGTRTAHVALGNPDPWS